MNYHPFELKIEQLETLNFELETIRSQETEKAIKGGWCNPAEPICTTVGGHFPGENGQGVIKPIDKPKTSKSIPGWRISLGGIFPGENGMPL